MDKFTVIREHNDLIGWHYAVYECGTWGARRYWSAADAQEYINERLFSD